MQDTFIKYLENEIFEKDTEADSLLVDGLLVKALHTLDIVNCLKTTLTIYKATREPKTEKELKTPQRGIMCNAEAQH